MMLWNIVFDMLLRKFNRTRVKAIGFADDGDLLIHGKDLDRMFELMQEALHKVEKWANECGLKMSTSKTVAILFTRRRDGETVLEDRSLQMNGQEIEFKNHTKYLGITLDKKLTWNEHIKQKSKQAKKLLMVLRSSLGKTWGPKPELTKWIWTGIIRPMICYGSFIWGSRLLKGQIKKLGSIQRMCLMLTGHVRRSTPTEGLNVAVGIPPIHLYIMGEVIKARLRLKEKLIRDWNGKGPGKNGKKGHIKLADELLKSIDLPEINLDKIDKQLSWSDKYRVNMESLEEGKDDDEGYICYTDGSQMENRRTGYGATLRLQGKELRTMTGYIGCNATVFQAECRGIIAGAELVKAQGIPGKVIFKTDNQSVLYALESNMVESETVRDMRQTLNELCSTNQVEVSWIKAG